MNDEDLDQRLSRLSRTAEVDASTLARLAISARQQAVSSRRRSAAGLALSALLVIGGLLIATPASAGVRHFLAQLGLPIGGGSEVIPDSEWIDLSAADLREYIASIFPDDLPIAPNQTREGLIDGAFEMHEATNTITQEVGIRRSLEVLSYCGWALELRDAATAGDGDRYDRAASTLLDAADWPALVATDGGGITDRLRDAGEAAVRGDRGSVSGVYTAGECDILGFDEAGSVE